VQAGVFLYDTTQLKTMTQQHPITPPPELVRQWMERIEYDEHTWFYESYIAEQAAQWGADQELEACIDWIANARNSGMGWDIAASLSGDLRAARRPKPPSLKEQALEVLDDAKLDAAHYNIILRALEALPDE
jgi:hypothetical protein